MENATMMKDPEEIEITETDIESEELDTLDDRTGPLVFDEAEVDAARADGRGYCSMCEEFTTPGVSPMSTGHLCIDCLHDGVLGVDKAVAYGHIKVSA